MWKTPWVREEELDGDIGSYDVEMEVHDKAGNTETELVEVPPSE